MAPRAKKKSGMKDRIKRRVKALRPVEAPLMSKAKTDDPKAQQPSSSDSKADSKGDSGKTPDSEAKADEARADDKNQSKADDKSESKAQEADSKDDAKAEAAQASEPDAKDDEPSVYADLIPPAELPDRAEDADAPAPGLAPPGDSRSFRRTHEGKGEFCLIYRIHRELVVRRGPVGKWGQVDITQYPTEASAATAYAHACSDLTGEGFYDLRE